jgi:hypothetical protein
MLSPFLDRYRKSVVFFGALVLLQAGARAQVSVVTAHNDNARTGQNLNETVLNPSNVNVNQFGKLFGHNVNGAIFAQPLYVPQVPIATAAGASLGTHNIVIVATTGNELYNAPEPFLGDSVYAFDADTNGGQNASALWSISLLSQPAPTPGEYPYQYGVVGTPVINTATNTLYLVDAEMLNSKYVHRLHAINITNGQEKAGSPVIISASVPGTGAGSANGTLVFNDVYELQRPALMLQNNVLYIGFGSVNDEGPWHGWLFSYNPTTLQQIDNFCMSPDGTGAGIWMGGAGLAGEVNNPAKPFGRMFVTTGNGTLAINAPTVAGAPYSNPANEYGMSVVDLDLTNGIFTVEDLFSPYDEASLSIHDADFGSGGPVLLPTQTLASGKILNPLLQIGKTGTAYILDRDNANDGSNNPATEYSPAGLGGFNGISDQAVQEVQSPVLAGGLYGWGAGVWGTEAYWNGNIYSGGTNPGLSNSVTASSFVNGVLSSAPTSETPDLYSYPGPTPDVSANGNTNGILWTLNHNGVAVLEAYDATNLANLLYTSAQNPTRDNAGTSEEYIVPTIANGKVYVGTYGILSVYGLLGVGITTATPTIKPGTSTFYSPLTVTITDPGATIYYTTDGSTPVPNTGTTQVYTGPLTVSTNETISAIGSITGDFQSAVATATYTSAATPSAPAFSLAAGTYTGAQTLTMTAAAGSTIYYTVDGSAPTSASLVYAQPLTISATQIVQAVAISPGPYSSSITSASYVIQPAGTLDFSGGFATAQGPIQFNGSTDLDDFRLQLTNGGTFEAGSAFYATPVNIQEFTTDFTFQLSGTAPIADGITFTIQGQGPKALGGSGGNLGYGGIKKSLAIKFDTYSNAGEGPDSTGLYLNGADPDAPAISLVGTGIDFHSGDYFHATITYDGSNLALTITDGITLTSWSHVFTNVNIPSIVGGNTAYVGFTGGTGGIASSQKFTAWTYVPGAPLPSYSGGFSAGSMTLNGGAALSGSQLELTDGGLLEARSAFFTTPVNVQQFSTNFQFQLTSPSANGFTFAIQGVGPTALGADGSYLGYGGIAKSMAIKFDLYNSDGEGPDSTGMYLNGVSPTVPATDLSSTNINLHSGDVFDVQLSYDGITLTEVITDTVTNASVTETYTVDIPALVGGTTAWVGFTGATGGEGAVQEILNWSYSPVAASEPEFFAGFAAAASQMTLNKGATFNGTRLRLTDGNPMEARSAFFNSPVSIQNFATSFDFQLTNPTADGFTFAIQGNSPTAVGTLGGWLGTSYGKSVVVKFDLYSNAGEGPDSTGLFVGGIEPTVGSTANAMDVNLSSTGINLHSGDTFNAQLTYNGTTLTVVITDKVTKAAATQSYPVNIPAAVGGPTAYVGFTAATGGGASIQEILDWNFASAGTN